MWRVICEKKQQQKQLPVFKLWQRDLLNDNVVIETMAECFENNKNNKNNNMIPHSSLILLLHGIKV